MKNELEEFLEDRVGSILNPRQATEGQGPDRSKCQIVHSTINEVVQWCTVMKEEVGMYKVSHVTADVHTQACKMGQMEIKYTASFDETYLIADMQQLSSVSFVAKPDKL